ncbi:MAG: MFS transporter [Deltaproteobacteria bacterium]|nr:MFS transporter [Deltaproteobacteria bacterium]
MAEEKRFHWAWVILGTCFFNLFVNYSIRLGYGLVLPEMIRDLGLSRTAGGTIYNAYLFSYLTLTPLSGFLTDRLGGRRVITVGALILGIGVLFMGAADSMWTACLAYAIAGIGATGMWTPIITIVQRWFASHRRGLALGILSTGYGLGFAAMGALFPFIVHQFSWRHSWYFLGMGALVMVAANALLLRSDPETLGIDPWGERSRAPEGLDDARLQASPFRVRAVFGNRRFWFIGASYFSISYCLYGITTFMVDYARYQLGVPLEKASLLATVHGACQVIGVLTILPLSDYLGRRKTIILSNACIACCLAGIVLGGHSTGVLFFLVGVLAMFYGATFPIYGACAGDYFPKEVMGTVMGLWTPFYGLGAVLVHWITGALRDSTGGYNEAFLITAVMGAVAVVLMAGVGKRNRISNNEY